MELKTELQAATLQASTATAAACAGLHRPAILRTTEEFIPTSSTCDLIPAPDFPALLAC
jgi:hypothetical protein